MERSRTLATTLVAAALLATCLVPSSALAQPFPPGPADDTTQSLGQAIIWVHPAFHGLVSGLPGWGLPSAGHWTTPVMFDPNTVIGRSNPHLDGGPADVGGTLVGTAGTVVSDASFTIVPTLNFTEGPPGTKEIHTELYSLNMQDICSTGITVRAGTGAGVPFPSFGEVEAKPGSADFPAESFFNVFIEMDTPFGTLFNMAPLLVVNGNLTSLPPTVVYIHEETPAVAVYFQGSGQLFGYLRLAGHKVFNGQERCPDPCGLCPAADELEQALESQRLMKCPKCVNSDVEPVDPKPVSNQ